MGTCDSFARMRAQGRRHEERRRAETMELMKDKEWVKALVGRPPMTAHEIGRAKEAAGEGRTYGPDVVTKLKQSRGVRVIPEPVPGKARAKLYRIELEED